MELTSDPPLAVIGEGSLQNWEVIGSGGFGQIYKARHVEWGWDVAVKVLHNDNGSSASLLREAQLTSRGSSPYVVRVQGVFQGWPPHTGPSRKLGLVMEFMWRGSLASLQEALRQPPPWPLGFQLSHQVALGMNYLHSLTPPLLHLDLKPSNVLLDPALNVKLTDFGLARYSESVTRSSSNQDRDGVEEGGTINYMPPEAFDISYKPSRAADVYSYGILLWTIVTAKKPYENAMSSQVRLRIPMGDRPQLDEVDTSCADGLAELVELMQACWAAETRNRPAFPACIAVTEKLYELHERGVTKAVHTVLRTLDKEDDESKIVDSITKMYIAHRVNHTRSVIDVPTGPPPTQEICGGSNTTHRDDLEGHTLPFLASVTDPSASHKKGPPLFTKPVEETTPAPSSQPSIVSSANTQERTTKRQISNPEAMRDRLPTPAPAAAAATATAGRYTSINMSSVTGLQIGDYNHLTIITGGNVSERKRHSTAPSSVNIPRTGSRKDKD